jgi:LysM repeat protein
MKKVSLFGFIVLLAFNAFSFPLLEDSIGVDRIQGKLHIKYLVMPGETIYGISTKYGVSISDLMDINPDLMNGLKVGQQIYIPYNPDFPVAQKKQEENNTVFHVVQPGETLYAISKKYDISVSDLMKYNNMDLKSGQKIVVGYKNQTQVPQETKKEVAPGETVVKKEEPKKEQKEESKKVELTEKKVEEKPVSNNFTTEKYPFDPEKKQVLVIPFDPYLYFSDADQEIAARSNIHSTKVRQVFRNRLNSLLRAPGYETIHLLGGKAKDSLSDINKIYSSVTYNYQEVLDNPHYKEISTSTTDDAQLKKGSKSWLDKQKEKLSPSSAESSKAHLAKDGGKYFGVLIKNPEFFTYFNYKYDVDYYIFINQFEVKTNYENCLDRATQNYERVFITHFSIFDNSGKQIGGNKFKTYYHSNSNSIYQIVSDNMEKIAARILAELPPPSH